MDRREGDLLSELQRMHDTDDAEGEEHAKQTRDIRYHIEDYLAGRTDAARIVPLVERWLIGQLARPDTLLGDAVKQSSQRAA